LGRDAAVIGGGIIGLSIARELQARGLDVVVFEKGQAAREASWAGAGMLAPDAETFPDAQWERLARDALTIYPGWVDMLRRESGLSIDFHAYPGDATVDPRDVCRALRSNLRIEEGVEVSKLDSAVARSIVVAAGAWSGQIEGLPPTLPVKGWLLAYDMPPGSLNGILRRGHTYILQRSTGLTIVGSTEQRIGFDRSADPDAIQDLKRRGADLWPELAGRRPSDAWCGFRPATPSGVPEHGRLPGTNVWLAYGHFRNGILLAPVVAKQIAGEVITSLRTG
jgi:glycine/D-amino acid oxidase-like deaminating enzyme